MNERRFDLLRVAFFCFIALCSQAYCCSIGHAQQDDSRSDAVDGDLQFVQEKVLPLLREHCYECHSHRAGKARGGLVLDSLSSILVGGDSGPAVEPGNPDSSLLIEAIRFEGLEMPPEGQLDEESIQILTEWIQRQSADLSWSDSQADGGANASPGSMHLSPTEQGSASEPHWAFRPLPSAMIEASSPSDAIDVLVQRARRSAGVEAVSPADKRTVVLRLFSDLIGLPPTPEQLERMTGEDSPSLDVIVDELLATPEFGERWGRHWLDVARYSDSNGCSIESNNTHDNAWRYRDYVIAAFNEDKPYDEFIVQQLAGDLLDSVSDMQRSENLIATGFLVMGPKAFGSGFDELEMDVIDEQIDTLGKAALGLSLGCARCHDHKFDPVTTKDYYALAGIFSSTQSVLRAKGWRQGKSWNRVELPVLSKEASQALRAAYEQTQKQAESGELVKQAEEKVEQTRQAIEKLRHDGAEPSVITDAEAELDLAKRQLANAKNMKTVLPVISPVPVAMGVVDKSKPQDEALRIRGEFDNRGEVVPRRVLPLVQDSSSTDFEVPEEESGRMQLAKWLVDEKQGAGSLVARVAVNRIWGRLLGRPLVDSVDNFGTTGSKPSHPELLDYLANRFIQSNWSTKTLIRDIVLSQVYGLSAEGHAGNVATDPNNQWLWRFQPKRVDVEVLRDSMLALSGKLDRTRGGKTLQHLGLVSLGGDHICLESPSPYARRTVYIPIYRDTVGLASEIDASMGMLKAFDFADPNLMTGARTNTVVPAQTLFLMNADFVYEQAQGLASRVLNDAATTDKRIERLTELVYGRGPTELERGEFKQFLDTFQVQATDEPVENHLTRAGDSQASASTAAEQPAWTALCQSMFGSNEFLFLD